MSAGGQLDEPAAYVSRLNKLLLDLLGNSETVVPASKAKSKANPNQRLKRSPKQKQKLGLKPKPQKSQAIRILTANMPGPADELISVIDYVRWANTLFEKADIYFGQGNDNAWDEAVALVFGYLHLPYEQAENIL